MLFSTSSHINQTHFFLSKINYQHYYLAERIQNNICEIYDGMAKHKSIEVAIDAIPHQESMVLLSSSFFQKNPKCTVFPSPKDVRSAHQKSMQDQKALDPQAPHIVRYPSLGLCVKYSQRVRLTNEARALCLLNRH